MRAAVVYTASRLLVFVVTAGVLYLLGARGLLLLGVAVLVSGLVSYVLLAKQRDALSHVIVGRINDFRQRIDEGARAEDVDEPPARS